MKIAITGIGIVSALGVGKKVNHERLLEASSSVARPTILPTSHSEWPIGEVGLTNQQLQERLGITDVTLTRNVLLGMVALQEAIEDAKLSKEQLTTTPFANGTTVGGMDLTEQFYLDWKNGKTNNLDLICQHEADRTTTLLAEHFGLASSATLSTACSSALNAMIYGAGLLRTGEAKQVVVGGTEAMTRFHLNGFAALGILSERICRPFQEDRDGINLGEGAAYLVLEDAETAIARGATIYGYLAGYANRCDAYHQTASSPEGDGALDAMENALRMAGASTTDIPYVNAHGTATPNNDASEMRAIERLFGEQLPRVESTKPLTGHTTSASGSIEAIFTLFRMVDMGYSYAISNAFGFGGNDSSIVLSTKPVELPQDKACGGYHSSEMHSSTGELDYKPYIPAMQARRMTPLMRQLIVVAKEALQEADIETPDGIVVGTRWGGMIPTMQLLNQLVDNGEQDFSPAQFMNSTHNGAAGTLARTLQCKGYNTTVVSEGDTFAAAKKDAELMLMTGQARSILVCSSDEIDEDWRSLLEKQGITTINEVKAQVLCID